MKNLITSIITAFMIITGFAANAQETIISKNELPKEAQKFISKYFLKTNIDYVKKDKETFSTNYTVRFTDGKEVDFDSKGKWTEVDGIKNPIPTSFINNNIKTYVKEKFPNTSITKINKGSFGSQEVKLSNGLELEFNSKGQFKKIDD